MTTSPPARSSTPPVGWAYCRFSTRAQAKGDSGRRQKDKAKDWCDNHGFEVHYLEDCGISAYRGKNRMVGQFAGFVDAVRKKKIGSQPLLLIENFDRMSREVIEEAQALFLQLIGAGAVIITLHNGKRYKKPLGLVDTITALVEMDLAHQYSANLSRRVKAQIDRRRAEGKIIHTGSSTPPWLTLAKDRSIFEPRPERVAIVRKIFNSAGNGQSASNIARDLNVRKVGTWSKARYWTGATIRNLLHNRTVLGEYRGSACYFGDAVVSEAQWAAVNAGACRTALGRGKGLVKERNLFAGFVHSGVDDCKMILRSSGGNQASGKCVYYLVSNPAPQAVEKKRHRVRYSVVEERILWLLGNVDPGAMEVAGAGAEDDTQERKSDAEARIAQHEKAIKKLMRLIEDDDSPPRTVVVQIKYHESELVKAVTDRERAKMDFEQQGAFTLPESEFEYSRPEVRRSLRKMISRGCSKIEISKDHIMYWLNGNEGFEITLQGLPRASWRDVAIENQFREDNETRALIEAENACVGVARVHQSQAR